MQSKNILAPYFETEKNPYPIFHSLIYRFRKKPLQNEKISEKDIQQKSDPFPIENILAPSFGNLFDGFLCSFYIVILKDLQEKMYLLFQKNFTIGA